MRLLLGLGGVAAFLFLGGRLAWNALEINSWSGDPASELVDSLTAKPGEHPRESTTVISEDSIVPVLNLPKVELLDKLDRPARGIFGSRPLTSQNSSSIPGGIVIPPSSRAGSLKSPSSTSPSKPRIKIGAHESAPGVAYGLQGRSPVSAALNTRNFSRPRFNFTSETRRINTGNPSRRFNR